MCRTVLVTGFAPFRHHAVNSSWEGARRLSGVMRACLPVDHAAAASEIAALVARHRPETVLLTGLAEGAAPRLERVARRPQGWAGPDLRHGRWPFARAREAIGFARLSEDAGGFVCESTYWTALGLAGPRQVAFLHVPPLGPGWDAGRVARAMRACLMAVGVR